LNDLVPVPAAPAALMLVEELWRAGAITKTHLDLGDKELSYDTYEAMGAWLGTVKRSSSWWLGDWLAYGEEHFRETVYQAALATGMAEQTLANCASIARRVPASVRRPDVPFHLHAELAALKPAEQAAWLDRIETEGLTRAQLREEIAQAVPVPPAVGEVSDSSPSSPLPAALIEEAAREVIRKSRRAGLDYLVPETAFQGLVLALGAEFDA
jgi:hypothetical protein